MNNRSVPLGLLAGALSSHVGGCCFIQGHLICPSQNTLLIQSKLKSTRERAKLSLEEAASSCSLSAQQINSLEKDLDVGFFNAHFKEIAAKKYITYLGLSQSEILMH